MNNLLKEAFGIALCAGLLYFAGCRGERTRWEGRMAESQAAIAKRDSTIWRLRADSAALATQHTTDTLVLTKWLTRWREVKRTDTLSQTDTLTITQVIYLADSTINACTTAMTSCERLRQNAEFRASALDSQNADLRKLLARPKPLVTPSRMLTTALLIFAATKVF